MKVDNIYFARIDKKKKDIYIYIYFFLYKIELYSNVYMYVKFFPENLNLDPYSYIIAPKMCGGKKKKIN